jgi:hypothetical protein
MGEMKNVYEVMVGKLEGRNHLEELGEDERIILERF